jgi:hypothetical protein
MIDFSVCKNCNRPIYFDWKGAHHVHPDRAQALSRLGAYDTRLDFSKPECEKAEEAAEEE